MQKSIEKPSISSAKIIVIKFLVIGNLIFASLLMAPKAMGAQPPAAPAPVAEMLYKPGTELVTGSETPNPLTPYDQYADAKPYAAIAPNETPGCKSLAVWEPVVVSRLHWSTVASPTLNISTTGVLAIAADVNCVKLGQPMHVAELHSVTGITTTLGWFLPTGLATERPEYFSQEDRLKTSAGLLGYKGTVMFVSGRVLYHDRTTSGRRYAPRMLGVRMITRKQMETAIHDGAQIIDVRSKKQYSAAHVKGAVHVPYTAGPRMKIFDEYANYVKVGDAFDIRRVNQDKQKPVILMSEGPFADNVFRAAIVLRSEGWKQIFVFYEGFDYFAKMLWKPPAASGLFETIVRPEAFAKLRKAPFMRIIDVRTEAEFAASTIQGAFNFPFVERDDLRMRRAALNGDVLRQYGDTWKVPEVLNKHPGIIFVGDDANDWRAYKAALIAKSIGFRRVFWFRSGFDSLSAMAVDRPEEFPIVRGDIRP